MNVKERIERELQQVPEPLLEQVLTFVRFLKAQRVQEQMEATLLSESALQKDWLRPEEDEAWRDL
jgi:hypothetical protein